ncbi:hypothetical protein ACE6H2_005711 [Prunus campanulata]
MFRHDLGDPSNRFSSWVGKGDCCNWTGVVCDNLTGHVLELHLAGYMPFTPSFSGTPDSLSEVESLQWISGLSQLQHLDMSCANLSKASDWLRVTNTLPSLVESFHMSACGLYHIPAGIANMTNLKFLDLQGNYISSTIPKWLYRLSHLQSLILSYNLFHGEISSSLGNLTSIVNLDMRRNNLNGSVSEIFESPVQIESLSLSENNLSGQLTDKLGNFEKLRKLNLAYNSISGPLPPSFGNLSCLEVLRIDDNNLSGVISQLHFTNLTRLVEFFASGNSLTLETTPHWLPPFQLSILDLDSWHLESSEFPMWLQSQTQLGILSMSNTRISGTIPTWFWNFSSALEYIDLSENKLYGEVPPIFPSSMWLNLYIGSNQFHGSLPLVSPALELLDLSNSSFSGTLFHFFCNINNSEPKVD